MAIKDDRYQELREIVLWQQLNKQVIELRDKGIQISEQNLIYLQEFCFQNDLFHRLTKDPLLDDIPLAFVSDLSKTSLVTFHVQEWTNCFKPIFNKSIILDLDLAVAQTFDQMREYEKELIPQEAPDPDELDDGDGELYGVIDRYNSMVEEQGRDLQGVLKSLYEMKGEIVSRLLLELDAKECIVHDGSAFKIDLRRSSHGAEISNLYDQFCVKALDAVAHLTKSPDAPMKDMQLTAFFDDILSGPMRKKSISEFIEHEREIQLRQSEMLNHFYKAISKWRHDREQFSINICDTSPFVFLAELFPTV